YGSRGGSFVLTICRLARERDELRVVDDQTGAPTWSRMIAEATASIVARSRARARELFAETSGVYHLSAAGATTWCGFTREILRAGPGLGLAAVPRLGPLPTAAHPNPPAPPPQFPPRRRHVAEAIRIPAAVLGSGAAR